MNYPKNICHQSQNEKKDPEHQMHSKSNNGAFGCFFFFPKKWPFNYLKAEITHRIGNPKKIGWKEENQNHFQQISPKQKNSQKSDILQLFTTSNRKLIRI